MRELTGKKKAPLEGGAQFLSESCQLIADS
jgi:hypothetical protein